MKPHKISLEEMCEFVPRQDLASATTADLTQRKFLSVEVQVTAEISTCRFVVRRRYFVDSRDEILLSTPSIAEAVDLYNQLS